MRRSIPKRRWLVAVVVSLCAIVLAGAAPATTLPALPAPVLGKSVDVAPVSGHVTVTVPGMGSEVLSAPRQVPVNSVIDAAQGAVELTAADSDGKPPYSGHFSEGEFEVRQQTDGGGTTQIILEGQCTKDDAASGTDLVVSPAHGRPHSRVQRYLQITANGKFVIESVNGTVAEVGAASWVVNDKCDGTTSVNDRRGRVDQTSRAGHPTDLAPGESGEFYCRPPQGRLKYCETVYSDPDANEGTFQLQLSSPARSFDVCLIHAGRNAHCLTGALKPNRDGVSGTSLDCFLNQLPKGSYLARFLVMGKQVGIELPFRTDHVDLGPSVSGCIAFVY